jgi:hypothetical protein
MAFMMNKLSMINSCEIILEKIKIFIFAKNHCEIQVHTVLVCTLYLIKYRMRSVIGPNVVLSQISSSTIQALESLNNQAQCYKTFYVRNLRMFVISKSVRSLHAFLA